MAPPTQPAARAAQRREAGLPALLAYLAVGIAALLPRVSELDRFLTVDEVNFWVERSSAFLNAVRAGDWPATAISTHPGVTTMWLGAAGIALRRALNDAGLLYDLTVPGAIALMRLPIALTHTLGVLAGYALLRRMLPAGAALLAALLWAADPFLIGFGRLLHVDALLATFATLSVLAACRYWHGPRSPSALVLSGACAGLAMLSKSPGAVLAPVVACIALWAAWRASQGSEAGGQTAHRVALSLCLALLAWGAIAAATMLLLWPALWAAPLTIYEQLRVGVEVEGAQPHMLGNFFLGRADDAPGVLFYPVALALRLTPLTLAGLLLLPLAMRLETSDLGPGGASRHAARRAPHATWRSLAALAGFAVVFTLAMSPFPKKFNRYLLPIFPAVDILAAAGIYFTGLAIAAALWRLAAAGRQSSPAGGASSPRPAAPQRLAGRIVPALAAAAALANAAWWHPYGIAAFNQALGGAPAGARSFAVGWGEGFELVAAWLNQQPDITGVATVSRIPVVQNPYMRRGANAQTPRGDELPPQTGYVVVYVSQVQGGLPAPPFASFYTGGVPLHTVRIHGVDYAWIYQAPPPVSEPRPAAFGDALLLRGFDAEGDIASGSVLFRLAWEARASPPADYTLFAHLIGPDGARVAQVDLPYPTASWQPGRFLQTELPIALPPALPPGAYRLLIGLYTPATGQRLPLRSRHTADPSLSGADALLLATLEVP